MNKPSLFVAGTDTGVGKTLAATALLRALQRKGLRTAAMKPVASGSGRTPEGLRNQDALSLQANCSVRLPYTGINPYCFEAAIAPHIAAADAGISIELQVLKKAHQTLSADADIVVIEGAGGWLTPLNKDETLADFAKLIQAQTILVVGLRLGCINHALLTANAIRGDGLNLAGWIVNTIDPQMPRQQENIAALKQRLRAPLLGIVPYDPALTAEQAADYLDVGALV